MANIFINYRRDDSLAYVGRIRDHLEKVYDPSEIFLDIRDIEGGEDYTSIIETTIKKCECCIVVIGPDWLKFKKHGKFRLDDTNDWVRKEITLALKYGIKIVPLLVGKAKMPEKSELIRPLKGLAKFNALDLSDERFSFDMKRLISSIGGATGTIRFFIHKSLQVQVSPDTYEHLLILDEVYMGKITKSIQVKEGVHKIQVLEGPPPKPESKFFAKIYENDLISRFSPFQFKDPKLKSYYPNRSSNKLRFRIKGGQNIKIFLANHCYNIPGRGDKFYIGFYTPIAEL